MRAMWQSQEFSARSIRSAARFGRARIIAEFVRLRGNTAGTIIVLAGLTLPIVIGGMGLGAEVGLWYYTQRQIQHAADTAAHGAGVRSRQGDSQTDIDTAALALATAAGFNAARGTIQVNNPPISGPNVGNGRAVEVLLTETMPRLFSSIFSKEPVVVSGRAVTVYTSPANACVLALAPKASSALKVSGGTSVNLNNCDTASNSMASDAFDMQGSAGYATKCVHTVGYAQPTSGLSLTGCPKVDELAPITPDPYADVPMPSVEGACHNKHVGNPQHTTTLTPTQYHSQYSASGLKAMRFCDGLQVKGEVHFASGLYIIEDGDFTVNASAKVTGDNVIFFFTDGARLRLNGGADLTLTAPDSGIFSGILFFGDRTEAGVNHHVNGGSNTSFTGAVYFPSQAISYNGGAGAAGGCTQIIGYTIEFTGNSNVSLDCSGVGTADIEVAGAVEIVE